MGDKTSRSEKNSVSSVSSVRDNYLLTVDLSIMFSYFHSPITNIRPSSSVSLDLLHRMITSNKWAQTTAYLRSLLPNQRYKIKCTQLNFVTFSGIFTQRKVANLVRHSNLLCFDYDHICNIEQLRHIRQQLIADSALDVQLLFRSPSGDGLKVVVRSDTYHEGMSLQQILSNHASEYQRISHYIWQKYRLQSDKTSDIARACFLCHDPEAYIKLPLVVSTVNRQLSTDSSGLNSRDTACRVRSNEATIEQMIQRIEAQQRDVTANYHDWFRIGMALANEFGEAGRTFYHRISCYYPRYTYAETNQQYDRCLRYNNYRIGFGTLIYLLN